MRITTRCEGTDPPIQIGRRVRRDARGAVKTGRKYWCQYCLDGKHYYEPLSTPSKAVAIRKAHEIAQRIGRGEERRVIPKHTLAEVANQYLDVQRNRGRSRKTLIKYTQVIHDVVKWFEDRRQAAGG